MRKIGGIRLFLSFAFCFALSGQAQEGSRLPDTLLYDSLVLRVMALSEYEAKLPPDDRRPHVLRRYLPGSGLTDADCRRIELITRSVNGRLRENHREALSFIRQARTDDAARKMRDIPQDHKLRLDTFNRNRVALLAQFKQELRQSLPPDTFERLEDRLNKELISRIHMLSPRTKANPTVIPPGGVQ